MSYNSNGNCGEGQEMLRKDLPATVPEKQPLQRLIPLQFVSEPEDVFLISEFEKIEQLRACLHHTKRGRLSVINQHGNATFSSGQLQTWWK